MAKFRQIQVEIDAVQWFPGNDALNKKYGIEQRGHRGEPYGFCSKSNTPIIDRGNWIWLDGGRVHKMTDAEFRNKYECG